MAFWSANGNLIRGQPNHKRIAFVVHVVHDRKESGEKKFLITSLLLNKLSTHFIHAIHRLLVY